MFCLIGEWWDTQLKKIQSKLHRIGTYEVYEISLSCFDNKIHIRWWY